MADSPAASVYNGQFMGDATVLGSGLAPLQAFQQQARLRAAQQARDAAAKAALERSFVPPTPDTDGGQLFAPQVAESAKGLMDYSRDQYQQAANGKLTAYEARVNVASRLAQHNVVTKRAKDAQGYIDKFRDSARTNFLDPGKVGVALDSVTRDPQTGKVVDINNFDPDAALPPLLTNADYLSESAAVNDFLDKAQLSHKASFTQAARPGQAGMQYEMNSLRLPFADNGRGEPLMIRKPDGTRVPKIANIEALDELANAHPQMAAIIKRRYQQGLDASAAAILNGDNTPAPSAQQTTADLLRGYGSINQVRREISPLAVPRPASSSAGAPKFTTNDPNAGGFANFGITTNRDKGSLAGSATVFQGEAPTRISSTGKVEAYTRDNAVFNEYIVQQPGKSAELVKNNTRPQNLQFESILHVLRTPTGNLIRPTQAADTKDEAAYQAWYKRTKAENPRAVGEWVVQATPKKGDNQLSSEEDAYRSLKTANEEASSPKSEAELRSRARKLVGEQNAVYYIPYTGDNARRLNAYTDNFYEKGKGTRQKVVDDFERRSTPSVTGPAALLQGPAAQPRQAQNQQPSGASRLRKNR